MREEEGPTTEEIMREGREKGEWANGSERHRARAVKAQQPECAAGCVTSSEVIVNVREYLKILKASKIVGASKHTQIPL
uniref:Uncharacterized protein n=1 Tax=Pristionchus pacificus TaxID=54126 RepID=A0A2A6CSJ5_PRIPA|eukprot:PDM81037.1 hypothetical protein PRIPAC_36040 [Pristionchus pacificus]